MKLLIEMNLDSLGATRKQKIHQARAILVSLTEEMAFQSEQAWPPGAAFNLGTCGTMEIQGSSED